jgi:hypothetical protein
MVKFTSTKIGPHSIKSVPQSSINLKSAAFPPGMKIRGGQIIIMLNFLVKITNIAYFWPFKGVLYPSGRKTEVGSCF